MNNWKVILATVVIFGAGVVTGGLLVNYVHNSKPAKAQHKTAEVRTSTANQAGRSAEATKLRVPEMLSHQFLQRLDDGLHLTPAQHEAIQKSISDGQNTIRKVVQDSRLEIRDVLSLEQQKQFDELVKRPFRKANFNTNAPSALTPDTNAPATNTPPP